MAPLSKCTANQISEKSGDLVQYVVVQFLPSEIKFTKSWNLPNPRTDIDVPNICVMRHERISALTTDTNYRILGAGSCDFCTQLYQGILKEFEKN